VLAVLIRSDWNQIVRPADREGDASGDPDALGAGVPTAVALPWGETVVPAVPGLLALPQPTASRHNATDDHMMHFRDIVFTRP
jgi:hypothetical protein